MILLSRKNLSSMAHAVGLDFAGVTPHEVGFKLHRGDSFTASLWIPWPTRDEALEVEAKLVKWRESVNNFFKEG
jgi:hypothetical protein